jgi:two-component system NtrC family response regulator
VGGRKEIPVDVRVVCATHQDLQAMIKEGRFREDLYYRINEATIRVPALRERPADVVVLARWFLQHFAQQLTRPIKGFTQKALESIEQYAWPGNVRELENRVKRAVIMAEGAQVTEQDLEMHDQLTEQEPFNLRQVRESAEYHAIIRALNYAENNVSRAAEMLGVTRPTLYNLMHKYDIKV